MFVYVREGNSLMFCLLHGNRFCTCFCSFQMFFTAKNFPKNIVLLFLRKIIMPIYLDKICVDVNLGRNFIAVWNQKFYRILKNKVPDKKPQKLQLENVHQNKFNLMMMNIYDEPQWRTSVKTTVSPFPEKNIRPPYLLSNCFVWHWFLALYCESRQENASSGHIFTGHYNFTAEEFRKLFNHKLHCYIVHIFSICLLKFF